VAPGTVAFVAAGPGDPDLLTVRGAALLSAADLILADPGASALAAARLNSRGELVIVDADETTAAVAKLIVEASRAGRSVVRLTVGDPVFDPAVTAEVLAVRKAKVSYDVVPGVPVVSAVPAYAGISLIDERSGEVRVIDQATADWSKCTEPHVTLVVPQTSTPQLVVEALINAGRSGQTPAAFIIDGTTVDQRTITGSLAELLKSLPRPTAKNPVTPTGVLIIGEAVGARGTGPESLSWFEKRPLFGWRVLVPRTKEQAGSLTKALVAYGAVSVEVPTISVEPPRTPQQMEKAIHGLVTGRYEWVVFTSTNAVRAVREKFAEYGLDARALSGLKIAAVGEQTAGALMSYGVRPDLVPSAEQSSQGLLEDFPEYDPVLDPINRVFLPRADIATETLVEGLTKLGWETEDVTAYRTVRAAPPAAATREAIKSGGFDAVIFTSSSTVRNLVGIAGKPHTTTVVACIGPATVKTAQEHGLRVDVIAETPSVAALAAGLAAHGEALRATALAAGEMAWRPSARRPATRRRAT